MTDPRSSPTETAARADTMTGSGTEDPRMSFQAAKSRLSDREPYDLVAGINCLNVENTIVHVLSTVCEGLRANFPQQRILVIVMDGNSTDNTRKLADFYPAPLGIDKEVVIQGFGPGKGNGVRSVLEIASAVRAEACAFADGDLISIRPGWLDYMLRPIVYGLTDLTVPYYLRDKWDGVITNHLVYPLTAALYGSAARQPIGGEFSLSRRYVEYLLSQPDMPGDFGIDIYITTSAASSGFRTMEVPLGIRVHASTIEYVDPRKTLHRMYREVVGEVLDLALANEKAWRQTHQEPTVLLVENVVPYFGRLPPSVEANEALLLDIFREGVEEAKDILPLVLPKDVTEAVEKGVAGKGLDVEEWIRAVYAIAAEYMVATEQALATGRRPAAGATGRDDSPRAELLRLLAALGMGRYLHFVRQTKEADLAEASDLIREQAGRFQELRKDLPDRLDALRRGRTLEARVPRRR